MHHEIHADEFDIFVKATSSLLKAAKWAEAFDKFHQIKASERRRAIFMVAEEVGLSCYTFCFYAISRENSEEAKLFWHKMAFSVVNSALQSLKNKEQAAFYHLQAASEIAPLDEEVLENLLSFHAKGLLDEVEAKAIAQKVLVFSPSNATALNLVK